MTKLEQLIAQLCSDGVEYRTLNTICNVYDGTHQTPQYTESGIKFASVENIADPYATEKYISVPDYEKYKIKPQRNDLLMTRIGSIGVCAVLESDEPLAYYVSLALLRPNNEVLNSRYLKYAIESLHCRKELRKRTLVNAVPIKINMGDIGKITLPVPPLQVQNEIVRILDNFTALTTELTTELTARKKQYEFYRNNLLSFDNSQYPTFSLRDIVHFRNGKGHEKDFVEYGDYVVITSKFISTNGESRKYSKTQLCPLYKDEIVMVMSDLPNGKALAKCYLIEENDSYTLNQRIGAFKTKDEGFINSKFLMYVLNRNRQLLRYDNGVEQTNLRKDDILDIEITVPPIEVQERLVRVLDNFDAICTDLNIGLPAEIEARQKQYEYYRDKLLTFKNVEG